MCILLKLHYAKFTASRLFFISYRYIIGKGRVKAFVMFHGYSDSLVFLLINSPFTKVDPA